MATTPRNRSAMKYAQDVVSLHDAVRSASDRLDDFISIGEDLLAMERQLKAENEKRPKGQEKIRWVDFRKNEVESKGCGRLECQAYVAIAIAANGYKHPGDSDKDEEPHLDEAKAWALENGKNIGVGARGLYDIIRGYKASLKGPKEKKPKAGKVSGERTEGEDAGEQSASELEALRERNRLLEIENQRLKDELEFVKTGQRPPEDAPKDATKKVVLDENEMATVRETFDAACNRDEGVELSDRWNAYQTVERMANDAGMSIRELATAVGWKGNTFPHPIQEEVDALNRKLQANGISDEKWVADLEEIAKVTKETMREFLNTYLTDIAIGNYLKMRPDFENEPAPKKSRKKAA